MSDERNEQAYRAVTGKSPATEPAHDFARSLGLLVRSFGGQQRTADALGAAMGQTIPRRTLRRWLAGENRPNAARRQLVEQAAALLVRRQRLDRKREARIRRARTVIVKARMRYRDEGAARTIKFSVGGPQSTRLDPGAIVALVDAYLAGATAADGPGDQNSGIFAPLVAGMDQTPDGYADMFREEDPRGLAFDVEHVAFR